MKRGTFSTYLLFLSTPRGARQTYTLAVFSHGKSQITSPRSPDIHFQYMGTSLGQARDAITGPAIRSGRTKQAWLLSLSIMIKQQRTP